MKTRHKILLTFISLIFLVFVIPVLSLFTYIYAFTEDIDHTKLDKDLVNIEVFNNNNEKINLKYDNNYTTIDEIPEYTINAFISIEDKRFYSHHGVDYYRIAGAAVNNLKNNSIQGASTITQQLIKNVYLDSSQTYDRKLKEIKMAIALEKEYSKEEILEKYFNVLYFGSGEYGIKNASLRFFDKLPTDLTISESAMLAAIIKSPTKYNPINNYDKSIYRTKIVLEKMYDQNFISKNELLYAKNNLPIMKNDLIKNTSISNYVDNVLIEAKNILNIDESFLVYEKYKIYTYLDEELQKYVFNSITNSYNDYNLDQKLTLSNIVIDNKNLGIKACYITNNLNINNYFRSPGSLIKPLLIYGPAIDLNIVHPLSFIENTKKDFNGYSPNNYGNHYSDYATVHDALIHSYNIPAVSLLNDSLYAYTNYLDKMNIRLNENDYNLSLALGGMTDGIDLISLLNAYTVFSNNGIYKKSGFIRRIEDKNGNTLYKASNNVNNTVFKESTCYFINNMLKDCANYGTAKKLNEFNFDIASKTATVSASNPKYNTDAYNIAYTSDDLILSYIGANEDQLLNSCITGGSIPTLMTKNIINKLYKNCYPTAFSKPIEIKEEYLDNYSYNIENKMILADDLCPLDKKTLIELPLNFEIDKDYSYSNMNNIDFNEEHIDNKKIISFTTNPRICYRLYKRQLFNQETLLDIKNKKQEVNIEIPCSDIFTSYILVPYFIDNNEEIITNFIRLY